MSRIKQLQQQLKLDLKALKPKHTQNEGPIMIATKSKSKQEICKTLEKQGLKSQIPMKNTPLRPTIQKKRRTRTIKKKPHVISQFINTCEYKTEDTNKPFQTVMKKSISENNIRNCNTKQVINATNSDPSIIPVYGIKTKQIKDPREAEMDTSGSISMNSNFVFDDIKMNGNRKKKVYSCLFIVCIILATLGVVGMKWILPMFSNNSNDSDSHAELFTIIKQPVMNYSTWELSFHNQSLNSTVYPNELDCNDVKLTQFYNQSFYNNEIVNYSIFNIDFINELLDNINDIQSYNQLLNSRVYNVYKNSYQLINENEYYQSYNYSLINQISILISKRYYQIIIGLLNIVTKLPNWNTLYDSTTNTSNTTAYNLSDDSLQSELLQYFIVNNNTNSTNNTQSFVTNTQLDYLNAQLSDFVEQSFSTQMKDIEEKSVSQDKSTAQLVAEIKNLTAKYNFRPKTQNVSMIVQKAKQLNTQQFYENLQSIANQTAKSMVVYKFWDFTEAKNFGTRMSDKNTLIEIFNENKFENSFRWKSIRFSNVTYNVHQSDNKFVVFNGDGRILDKLTHLDSVIYIPKTSENRVKITYNYNVSKHIKSNKNLQDLTHVLSPLWSNFTVFAKIKLQKKNPFNSIAGSISYEPTFHLWEYELNVVPNLNVYFDDMYLSPFFTALSRFLDINIPLNNVNINCKCEKSRKCNEFSKSRQDWMCNYDYQNEIAGASKIIASELLDGVFKNVTVSYALEFKADFKDITNKITFSLHLWGQIQSILDFGKKFKFIVTGKTGIELKVRKSLSTTGLLFGSFSPQLNVYLHGEIRTFDGKPLNPTEELGFEIFTFQSAAATINIDFLKGFNQEENDISKMVELGFETKMDQFFSEGSTVQMVIPATMDFSKMAFRITAAKLSISKFMQRVSANKLIIPEDWDISLKNAHVAYNPGSPVELEGLPTIGKGVVVKGDFKLFNVANMSGEFEFVPPDMKTFEDFGRFKFDLTINLEKLNEIFENWKNVLIQKTDSAINTLKEYKKKSAEAFEEARKQSKAFWNNLKETNSAALQNAQLKVNTIRKQIDDLQGKYKRCRWYQWPQKVWYGAQIVALEASYGIATVALKAADAIQRGVLTAADQVTQKLLEAAEQTAKAVLDLSIRTVAFAEQIFKTLTNFRLDKLRMYADYGITSKEKFKFGFQLKASFWGIHVDQTHFAEMDMNFKNLFMKHLLTENSKQILFNSFGSIGEAIKTNFIDNYLTPELYQGDEFDEQWREYEEEVIEEKLNAKMNNLTIEMQHFQLEQKIFLEELSKFNFTEAYSNNATLQRIYNRIDQRSKSIENWVKVITTHRTRGGRAKGGIQTQADAGETPPGLRENPQTGIAAANQRRNANNLS